jgi:hypothetical protein
VKKPSLERLTVEVVIGIGSSRWITVLNEKKPFADTFGIDRKMYLCEKSN